jgi:hypothetical protein
MLMTMYDSTNAFDIPAGAEIVGGYVDGHYVWGPDSWARFPNAQKVRIAVFSTTNDGDVLDVEPGNAGPGDAPNWIRLRQRSGLKRPTIYCSRSTVPAVQAACAGLEFDLWVAEWTGQPHLVPGSVATQYASPETGSGGHYDLSVTNGTWPSPRKEEDTDPMPVETTSYFNPKVQPADCPLDLALQVNTNLVLAFAQVRDYSGGGSLDAHVVLVGDDGKPMADQHLRPGATGTAEWRLPDNTVGDLVLQSTTAPCSVSVKFRKK